MVTRGRKSLPRSWGALRSPLKRAKGFCQANKKLTSFLKNFSLLLAKFGHFRGCLKRKQSTIIAGTHLSDTIIELSARHSKQKRASQVKPLALLNLLNPRWQGNRPRYNCAGRQIPLPVEPHVKEKPLIANRPWLRSCIDVVKHRTYFERAGCEE